MPKNHISRQQNSVVAVQEKTLVVPVSRNTSRLGWRICRLFGFALFYYRYVIATSWKIIEVKLFLLRAGKATVQETLRTYA